MATINLSEETKERFKILKLKLQARNEESISENKFLMILLDNFRERI